MLKSGILNPHLASLLARVRHTNTMVIADRGFPFWPQIETVDLSLVDNIPTVLQVIDALRPTFVIARVYMAREFVEQNTEATLAAFAQSLAGLPMTYESHEDFKKRVPAAVGLIRTADAIQYANVIVVSG